MRDECIFIPISSLISYLLVLLVYRSNGYLRFVDFKLIKLTAKMYLSVDFVNNNETCFYNQLHFFLSFKIFKLPYKWTNVGLICSRRLKFSWFPSDPLVFLYLAIFIRQIKKNVSDWRADYFLTLMKLISKMIIRILRYIMIRILIRHAGSYWI